MTVRFPRPFRPAANLLLVQNRGSEDGSLHPLHSHRLMISDHQGRRQQPDVGSQDFLLALTSVCDHPPEKPHHGVDQRMLPNTRKIKSINTTNAT